MKHANWLSVRMWRQCKQTIVIRCCYLLLLLKIYTFQIHPWLLEPKSHPKLEHKQYSSASDDHLNLYSRHNTLQKMYILWFFAFCLCVSPCRRLVDRDDELSDIQSDSVPSEVRDWLACTFTRQRGLMQRRNEDKPRFRSIVHAVQAGIFVERFGLF